MVNKGMEEEEEYAADEIERGGRKLTDIISIASLWQAVWRRRLMIVAFVTIGLVFSIYNAHREGPDYDGVVQIMAADSDVDRIGSLTPIPALLGGDTDTPPSKFKQFQAAIYSSPVAEIMENRYHLICRISPSCDHVTGQWFPRAGFRAALSRVVRTVLGMPIKTTNKPTPTEMAQMVQSRVTIKGTGIMIMTMSDSDQTLVVTFLSRLIDTTNNYLKDNDRQSLRQYVNYLSLKLQRLDIVAQRESLQSLLTEQSRRLMLTEVNVPYAAVALGTVNASLKNPLIKVLVLTVLSALFGALIAIVMEIFPGLFDFLHRRGR